MSKRYLYLGTDGTLFKIGVSDDPGRRAVQHGIRLVKVWCRPYAFKLECHIKGMFVSARARGKEWFAVSEAEIVRSVTRAVRIEDDERAISLGIEPSKRPCPGEPPYEPPFELSWLKAS